MIGPLIRKYAQKIPKKVLRRFGNIWAPFLGAGIHIDHIAEDFTEVDISMPLRWYNRNYVGTQYGGSMYSMVDPFYMMMLLETLGPRYVVWDKAASIEFLRPGRGTVYAKFRLSQQEINEIRRQADEQGKIDVQREIEIVNEDNRAVARVKKVLFVARKDKRKNQEQL